MATEISSNGRNLPKLVFGTFALLSIGVVFSEALDYFETGVWVHMSMMAFIDLLTEDGDASGGPSPLLGLRFVLDVIPVLPLFLTACLIALVWKPTPPARTASRKPD